MKTQVFMSSDGNSVTIVPEDKSKLMEVAIEIVTKLHCPKEEDKERFQEAARKMLSNKLYPNALIVKGTYFAKIKKGELKITNYRLINDPQAKKNLAEAVGYTK